MKTGPRYLNVGSFWVTDYFSRSQWMEMLGSGQTRCAPLICCISHDVSRGRMPMADFTQANLVVLGLVAVLFAAAVLVSTRPPRRRGWFRKARG
jgi:hypothetical protein